MKPNIRTALTADGNIEATAGATHRIVIDVRTGVMAEMEKHEGGRPEEKTGVSKTPVKPATLTSQGIDKNLAKQARKMADQTDMFLWLVTEARKYMQRERHRDINQVIARETSPENIWKLR